MRATRKKAEAIRSNCDDSRTAHAFLTERFGERFGLLISRPIAAVQRSMRDHGFDIQEAVDYLIQQAQDHDPGSAAVVIWLHAAAEELAQGTPVAIPATSLN